MLDIVAATTVGVTGQTIVASRFSNILCYLKEINRFFVHFRNTSEACRHSCSSTWLLVGTCCVVADQAINMSRVREIKICILPTIPYMAACAAWPIAINRSAEGVKYIFFPTVYFFTIYFLLFGKCPMAGSHNFFGCIFMTL